MPAQSPGQQARPLSAAYRYKLPNEAVQMAQEFAAAADAPELEAPLGRFLHRSERICGLHAVAIALRVEEDAPTLSVYAFADLRRAYQDDAQARETVGSVDAAHMAFETEIKRLDLPLVTDLWYVPANRKTLNTAIHDFGRKLLDDGGNSWQSPRLPVDLSRVAAAAFASIAVGR